jgi:hypothetical protein
MMAYTGVQLLLHTFLTLALDGGEWSALHHWGLPLVPTEQFPGWVLGLAYTFWTEEKLLVPAGNQNVMPLSFRP